MMNKLFATGVLGLGVASSALGVMSQVAAAAMDKDRDGKVTSEEYAAFYDSDFTRRDRGDNGVLTAEELPNKNLFRLGDRDKDGQVTREEFQGIYAPRFSRFDTNGDGLIAGDEIEHVPGRISKTVVYSRPDGKELALDIDLPGGKGPFPVVVWIHGGGWTGGDSSALIDFSQHMTLNGTAGVRINYRLASAPDAATLEQAFADVLASIAWVQSNADEYHFDMKRFGIAGASAGGHLSALAAQKVPGCIAYVGYCGGYDMVDRGISGWPNDGLMRRYFGKTDEATLKANSPIWQVRTSPPETLLIHGTADRIIDPDISVRFAEALRSRGGPVKLVQLEGASHGICHQREFKEKCIAETEEFLCRVFGVSPRLNRSEVKE
jgi:acetyl esterase/lipase